MFAIPTLCRMIRKKELESRFSTHPASPRIPQTPTLSTSSISASSTGARRHPMSSSTGSSSAPYPPFTPSATADSPVSFTRAGSAAARVGLRGGPPRFLPPPPGIAHTGLGSLLALSGSGFGPGGGVADLGRDLARGLDPGGVDLGGEDAEGAGGGLGPAGVPLEPDVSCGGEGLGFGVAGVPGLSPGTAGLGGGGGGHRPGASTAEGPRAHGSLQGPAQGLRGPGQPLPTGQPQPPQPPDPCHSLQPPQPPWLQRHPAGEDFLLSPMPLTGHSGAHALQPPG